jgi:RNA polymerase sigma-70 factor (ECF subfamily)
VVAGTQLQQQALEIHQRLLSGDPTASLDAAELLLDPLVNRLRAKWPSQNYIDACHDAATEVIVIYLQAPQRYDRARSALLTWLTMQAHGDLLNAYASPQKKFERGWIVESDLSRDGADGDDAGVQLGDQMAWLDAVPTLDASRVLASVRAAFPEERDRRLIWLMCIDGVHSTDDAAAVLDLMHLPPRERAAAVKRHKDRVMRRLRRLGLDESNE